MIFDSLCLNRSCRVDVLDNRTYLEHETYELGAVQTKLLHVYSRQRSHIGVLEFLPHNARSASTVLLSRPSVCQSVFDVAIPCAYVFS